ncbi:hypothetical protein D3C72_1280680 [compost metagenome]
MHAHRQRFDQRPGLCRETLRQPVQQVGGHVDQFGKGAVVHQAGEGQALADVVQAVGAVVAGAAMLAGVRSHRVTDGKTFHAFTQLGDLAAELVAEDALALDAGQRVRCLHRDEYRASDVFVQIGAADAAPVHLDLYPAGCRVGRQGHLFDANIIAAMPDGGTHVGVAQVIHCCSPGSRKGLSACAGTRAVAG